MKNISIPLAKQVNRVASMRVKLDGQQETRFQKLADDEDSYNDWDCTPQGEGK